MKMFQDAATYPYKIIADLKARVKELEKEVQRLKDELSETEWREDQYRELRDWERKLDGW